MAKTPHQEPPPGTPRNALLLLSAGGIAVAGLLGWALTRTVEPAPVTSVSSPVAETSAPVASTNPGTFDTAGFTQTAAPLTATNAPPPQPEGDKTAVTRISAEDLRAQIRRNEVTVIDVRDNTAYAQGHIPGAMHIAFASVQSSLDTIPKGKPIVTYCT